MFFITTVLPWIAYIVAFIFALHYKNISEKDRFTGCYTKDWAIGRPNSKLMRLKKKAERRNENFGILFIDMDDFKKVNDTKGHLVGDNIIKLTVAAIRDKLEKKDILVRFGGDEFMVIFPNIHENYLRYIAGEIVWHVFWETKRTISVGGAMFQNDKPKHIKDLVNEADSNVYKAKETKNCAVV